MTDDIAQPRRSHAERRAETIDLIVNAALAAITDVGLRNATTGEICRRAGVSPGALFHHFETRQDVIMAAVERQLADRGARFTGHVVALRSDGGGDVDPRELLRLLRSLTSEPRAMVWLEVLMGTRTDPELRARMLPLMVRQRELFRKSAALQMGVQSMPEQARFAWLELLRNVLHGAAMMVPLGVRPGLEERKIDALLALAEHLGSKPADADSVRPDSRAQVSGR